VLCDRCLALSFTLFYSLLGIKMAKLLCVLIQVDLLEGLQGSKLSFSSRSDSDSPLHVHHVGNGLPSPSNAKGGPLMPHSAWQALLDTCLPFLLAESKAAPDFLLLYDVAVTAPLSGSPVNHAGWHCSIRSCGLLSH